MELSIKDLKEVAKFFSKVQTQWYQIGVELKISKEELDVIKQDCGEDSAKCLLEMLTIWLNSVKPPPTWKILASALRNTPNNDLEADEGKYRSLACKKACMSCTKVLAISIFIL